ncbi:MAG: hypothetical protein EBY44_06550, partial [Actinobacteria bacterium]|nr:hypothetical protein [Actinomycetota bacterium]
IKVIRRNGAVVSFEAPKISVALTKAFLAVQGGQGAASARVREVTEALTSQVVAALLRRLPAGGTVHIEDIQDQVELALMRSGEHEIARAYVLYRERRSQERASKTKQEIAEHSLTMLVDGRSVPLDQAWLEGMIADVALPISGEHRGKIILSKAGAREQMTATPVDGSTIDPGERVVIVRVEGGVALVAPLGPDLELG